MNRFCPGTIRFCPPIRVDSIGNVSGKDRVSPYSNEGSRNLLPLQSTQFFVNALIVLPPLFLS
jgi:hypothetical protein